MGLGTHHVNNIYEKGFDSAWIEIQLVHVDKIALVPYNHAQYLEKEASDTMV